MSVEVIFGGRLGNNLFQYALGRIIAQHHQFELNCTPPGKPTLVFMGRELDIGPAADLAELTEYFPNAPLHIDGVRTETPMDMFDIYADTSWSGHRIDLDGLLDDRSPRKIRLLGHFQRYEYYKPYNDAIRHWFYFRPQPCRYRPTPRDVVLNIRRGFDYWVNDMTLSMAYYRQALAELRDVGNVYVCGTGIDDTVRSMLAQFEPIYYDATPIEHFGFLMQFNRIIISNSSFAWWAAYLSDAVEIFAPRSTETVPLGLSGHGDLDLNMNEPRYREIDTTGRARLALTMSTALSGIHGNADGSVVIEHVDGRSSVAGLAMNDLGWLLETIRLKAPVCLGDLRLHFKGDNPGFRTLLEQLFTLGIFSRDPIYLDEAHSPNESTS